MEYLIEKMKDKDWEAVRRIYLEGIATGHATFESRAPQWEIWDRDHLKDCRWVAKENNDVIGWAALTPVSDRCVSAGIAEVSIYVSTSARGKGVGKALLTKLAEASEKIGIWTLQGGIFPENKVSIEVHKACGFRIVGTRERLGKMNNIWRDVVLMERRSQRVGAD